MKKTRRTLIYMAQASVVAALYAVLTFLWPLSIGPLQCRISEALCVLPYLLPASVPGLFVGCFIGNLIAGALPIDVVFGSLATLLAAYITYLMGRKNAPNWLAPIPSVVVNAIVVGAILTYCYDYGLPYWMAALQVGGGQALSCFVLGLPLLQLLSKNKAFFKHNHNI